jgi:hypothetical protein
MSRPTTTTFFNDAKRFLKWSWNKKGRHKDGRLRKTLRWLWGEMKRE